MSFKLTILGCNSAIPTSERKPTAQLLNVSERFFLIDCGEGTQLQLRKYRFKLQSIQHIFISHLHGDHYFGLIGLISTMHLLGREKELNVYGPKDLDEILNIQLEASKTKLRYPLIFHSFDFDRPQVLLNNGSVIVETIPLDHSIDCCGFLFKEVQQDRRMRRDKITQYNIPNYIVPKIKSGADFTLEDGTVIPHLELTRSAQKARSFAFCSDTAYYEAVIDQIKGVDILYHEATFLNDMEERAYQTKHSTCKQAATIAKKAKVGKLIIGHYSQRYHDLQPLLDQAQQVFKNSHLAIEGECHELERTYDTDRG